MILSPAHLAARAAAARIAAPLEGVVVAAGTPASARIRAGNGGLWAEGITVSDQAGVGELQFDTLDLLPGRLLRILSAEIQG